MPRFYFHIRDKSGLIRDERGGEFDSLSEAHREAIELAKSMVAEIYEIGDVIDGQAIEISDASGAVFELVPLVTP
jgi:hypothetical protein